MSHIAMLLPREELVRQAQTIVKNGSYNVQEIRCISTPDTVEEATASVKNGASIIIARGLQALRITAALNVPVVSVRLTAQELGMLLLKAKRLCTGTRPRIALVAGANMLCDTSCCNVLFGVEMRVFPYENEDDYDTANQKALQWQPEAIIGGDRTLLAAQETGVPALFLDFLDDSLQEAIRSAETALYANEQNKRANAQFDALLNSTTNGYIQLNEHGTAVKINDIMRDILVRNESEILGKPLESIISGIEKRTVDSVLAGGNSYSTFLHIQYQAIVAILAPIRFEDGRVEGAVLSCHKVHRNIQMDTTQGTTDATRINISERNFDNIHQKSDSMTAAVGQAKLFSQSSSPILLVGERGLERSLMAQCIHNNSLVRNGPFVSLNCGGLPPESQMTALFGTGETNADGEPDLGAFGMATGGTLMLLELDKLSDTVQYNIYRALRYRRITQRNLERTVQVNVRLIGSCEQPLYSRMRQGEFRADLYYMLSGLKIHIPPLRQRKEDLDDILRESFQRICEVFRRYHLLTAGAWEQLNGFPWPGNTVQINSFFERLILTSRHRTIDEGFVKHLWNEMYPEQAAHTLAEPSSEYANPEAKRIIGVLAQCGGNRTAAAEALGISTTTLWRRMKKLGISGSFSSSV